MRNNIYWGLLFVVVCAVFCGCAAEKPDPEDYDVDKVVAKLVEHSKHHRKEPLADEPNQAENKQKPLADKNIADKEERVSPFGFGPYPEIPADFPIQDIFDQGGKGANFELMDRVWVELWKRGVRGISGMSISHQTGLVQPTIKGIAFADWEPSLEILGIGFGRRITSIGGHPEDMVHHPGHPGPPNLDGPKIKRGVKIFHKSEGIDPYLLLKIPKE